MTEEYQRGYSAGRRYVDRAHEKLMARMALAAAIAPSIIASPWVQTSAGGETTKLNTVNGMAGTVVDLVHAIERLL